MLGQQEGRKEGRKEGGLMMKPSRGVISHGCNVKKNYSPRSVSMRCTYIIVLR